MNQNYEKIKRACQIANPKLMEKSFGCEVVYGSDEFEPQTVVIGAPYEVQNNKVFNPWNRDDVGVLMKVLGHEPQLSDVLLAIAEARKYKSDLMAMSVNGGFYNNGKLEAHFDLTKPVKDQSEECLKFLADLL